jgi:hypothetical protein
VVVVGMEEVAAALEEMVMAVVVEVEVEVKVVEVVREVERVEKGLEEVEEEGWVGKVEEGVMGAAEVVVVG